MIDITEVFQSGGAAFSQAGIAGKSMISGPDQAQASTQPTGQIPGFVGFLPSLGSEGVASMTGATTGAVSPIAALTTALPASSLTSMPNGFASNGINPEGFALEDLDLEDLVSVIQAVAKQVQTLLPDGAPDLSKNLDALTLTERPGTRPTLSDLPALIQESLEAQGISQDIEDIQSALQQVLTSTDHAGEMPIDADPAGNNEALLDFLYGQMSDTPDQGQDRPALMAFMSGAATAVLSDAPISPNLQTVSVNSPIVGAAQPTSSAQPGTEPWLLSDISHEEADRLLHLTREGSLITQETVRSPGISAALDSAAGHTGHPDQATAQTMSTAPTAAEVADQLQADHTLEEAALQQIELTKTHQTSVTPGAKPLADLAPTPVMTPVIKDAPQAQTKPAIGMPKAGESVPASDLPKASPDTQSNPAPELENLASKPQPDAGLAIDRENPLAKPASEGTFAPGDAKQPKISWTQTQVAAGLSSLENLTGFSSIDAFDQISGGLFTMKGLDSQTLQLGATVAAPAAHAAAKQVAVTISKQVKAGSQHFGIRMDPPELGRVTVSLAFKGGHVQAEIAAERPETLVLLQRDKKMLERALEESGQSLEQGSITFTLEDPEGESAGKARSEDARDARKEADANQASDNFMVAEDEDFEHGDDFTDSATLSALLNGSMPLNGLDIRV